MEKLIQEIRANREPLSAFTVEKLQSDMPYLNACINEGLRMYPPVPTGLPRAVPEGGAAICGSWVPQDVRIIAFSLPIVVNIMRSRDAFHVKPNDSTDFRIGDTVGGLPFADQFLYARQLHTRALARSRSTLQG